MDSRKFFILFISFQHFSECEQIAADTFQIEGRLDLNSVKKELWTPEVNIMAHSEHGRKFNGYLRYDNSFVINCLPAGSYVVEVVHPVYEFQPARVDVFTKSKPRASKVFYVDSNKKEPIPYPLVFKEWKKSNYFETRNQTEIADIVKNPMMMQFIPMVIVFMLVLYMQQIMPMQSPEALQELRNYQQRASMLSGGPVMNFDLSEWLADYFYKPPNKDKEKTQRQTKEKRNPANKKKRNRTVTRKTPGLFNWIMRTFFSPRRTTKEEMKEQRVKKTDGEKAETGGSAEIILEVESLEENRIIKKGRLSKAKTRTKRSGQSRAAAASTTDTSAAIDGENTATGESSKRLEEGSAKSRKRKRRRQKKRIPQKSGN